MTLMRWIFPVAAAVLATGLAHAGDPVKLGKADLETLLTGKSISYQNINGSSTLVNFEKEGRVTYRAGSNKASVGTWQTGDDGRYCIKITSGTASDHCRRVWKTDTGYALSGNGKELVPVSGLD